MHGLHHAPLLAQRRPRPHPLLHPASDGKRTNLTLRGSTDDGKTWPKSLVIQPAQAAYSHLAVLKDGTIAIAYETDDYKRIAFRTLKTSELK